MSYAFSDGCKIRDQLSLHFLTFTIMGCIDIFANHRYSDIVLESFSFCRKNKRLRIGAYVIMSNHIHVIWQAGNNNLSDIIRDFKTYTSKAITAAIESEPERRKEWLLYLHSFYAKKTNANDYYKVWTGDNHPEEILSESFMKTKLDHIHNNPVRAGIVAEPDHYLYSSARNYYTGSGIIEIDFLY